MSKRQSILNEFLESGKFDPVEYMRRTRPEHFSDSVVTREPAIDPDYFEYHLESLTSRSQEIQFENFARRLAEVEICPNLRPQTGPTGGGDSKTDSSTYPVAQELADRTYWGTPVQATNENWAFAFSCKKEWKPKVKSDMKKIAGLQREFKKAYFISNQFVRDKDRGRVEEELSKAHGFEVHILDRNWIVGRVSDHHREDIAIETLGLSRPPQAARTLGPRDTARSQELAELLERLSHPLDFYANDYLLSADYRRAAMLSRALEKSRHEVDGLFNRARQLARHFGDTTQIINTCYDHAWTSLWWYNDPAQVAETYLEMEKHLSDIVDTEDCECFGNLLKLLLASLRMGTLSVEDANTSPRHLALTEKLEQLSRETHRPNNALYAETLLCITHLMPAWEKRKYTGSETVPDAEFQSLFIHVDSTFEQVCERLGDCLARSSGMTTYPLTSMVRCISQTGEFIDEIVPEYETLIEQAGVLVRRRSGERAEGKMLLERGQQLLFNGHSHEALLSLGRARIRLSKEESLEDSCLAALACCDAYLHLGSYWAARMEAIIGAVLALRVKEGGAVDPFLGLLSAKRMCSCELALGRVAPFLAWFEVCRLSLAQLDPDQYRVEEIDKDLQQLELSLACFFLNLDEQEATELDELVSGLETLTMPLASDALAYACGERDQVANQLSESLNMSADEIHESFERLRSQMPEDRIMRELTGETRSHWRFETKIMGVLFRVTSRNSFGPILFSENLLGALEALLAIARWDHLAFIVDEVRFEVGERRSGNNPPIKEPFAAEQTTPAVDAHYKLVFKPDMLAWMIENRADFCRWLHQFVLRVIFDATIDPMEDLVAEMDQWGEQGTFDRALSASPTSIAVDDLIGKDRYDLNYWYDPADPSSLQ